LRVVISHENITALKSAEEQLEEKTRHLEEANFALRAVIRQSNEARKEIEQIVLQNIRESVLPKVTELKHHRGAQSIRHLTEEIEKDLHEIASPFLQRLANIASVLTPQEMKIAMLIKDGKSSKEMAEQLNLSGPTINFHRQNLRKKLGLSGTGSNLRTYLVGLVN
jgi:DNA-binding CsgD family transcriptional regulator